MILLGHSVGIKVKNTLELLHLNLISGLVALGTADVNYDATKDLSWNGECELSHFIKRHHRVK